MPADQPDLFAEPAPPGLHLCEAFVSPEEEPALIASIDRERLTPFRYRGWTGKRMTASFGWRYDFDTGAFGPAEPIPGWLLPVRDRAAHVAKLDPEALAQALLIRYDPGAGIGWHRDRAMFEHVVGISLGAAATMRFRRRRDGGFQRMGVGLGPRSLYHLSGEARHEWEHSIAAMAAPRWSITFRSLVDVAEGPQ